MWHLLLYQIIQNGSGGTDQLRDMAELTTKIRNDLNSQSDVHRAIGKDMPFNSTAARDAEMSSESFRLSSLNSSNSADSFGGLRDCIEIAHVGGGLRRFARTKAEE
jgi:hypothetical protein